jgi:hypothetical protein
MRCLLCRKKIRFWGETCDYCGTDKSMAQSLRMLAIGCLAAGAGVGYFMRGTPGLIVGGLLGMAACLLIDRLLPKFFRHTSS